MTAVGALVLIALSVLLQAGSDGFLSGRLAVGGSLLFSACAFAGTTAVFWTLARVRGHGSPREPGARRQVIRLTVAMNVATAVTFLGFYLSLVLVPAALAASVMSGVGPLAVALLDLARGRPTTVAGWLRGSVLLAFSVLTALAMSTEGTRGTAVSAGALAGGLGLVLLAGFGAAYLATASRRLGELGGRPVWVMAHRFHLTYVVAAVLLVLRGGSGTAAGIGPGTAVLVALAGVVIPLYLLQIGLQRARPMIAMVLLTTLPGLSYLAQVGFGQPFDPLACVLVAALIALAVVSARYESSAPARPRRVRWQPVPVPAPVSVPFALKQGHHE